MPAVYIWRPLLLTEGEPSATIKVNKNEVAFPEPFDERGEITGACRAYIERVVAQAVERDGFLRVISWPDPPGQGHGAEDV